MHTINSKEFKSTKSSWQVEQEIKQSRKEDKQFRSARKNRKVMWEVL